MSADPGRSTVAEPDTAAVLRELFRTVRPVAAVAAPPSALMEAAIRAVVPERLLVLVGGSDGERIAQIAEATGSHVIRAMVPEGAVLTAEHLDRFLDGPDLDAVALAHADSSTGAQFPLRELARVVSQRPDLLMLVDASHSLSVTELQVDLWELDCVIAGSGGTLQAVAGACLVTTSKRFEARARQQKGRGWTYDLIRLFESRAARKAAAEPTSAVMESIIRRATALRGPGARESAWAAHQDLRGIVDEWAAMGSHEIVARPGVRSPALTALAVGSPEQATALSLEAQAAGLTITASGSRIILAHAHLGRERLQAALETLGTLLDQL